MAEANKKPAFSGGNFERAGGGFAKARIKEKNRGNNTHAPERSKNNGDDRNHRHRAEYAVIHEKESEKGKGDCSRTPEYSSTRSFSSFYNSLFVGQTTSSLLSCPSKNKKRIINPERKHEKNYEL
jgi:hypothetical protein